MTPAWGADHPTPAAVRLEEATVTEDDAIDVRLRAGGGFIARFDRAR